MWRVCYNTQGWACWAEGESYHLNIFLCQFSESKEHLYLLNLEATAAI